jgi:hypothetical protein
MARDAEWVKYFSARLAEAERELDGFKNAIAKYKLRVLHRDTSGERDVTNQHLRDLQSAIDEYRAMLRDD